MKLVNVVLTGLLISGLLIGCTEEGETKGEQVKTEETTIKQVAAVNPSKIWNDVSTPEGFNNYEIEPTLEAWIAYHAQDINKTTDVDEYYLRADRLTKEMIYFRVQGEDLQKDFENLNVLQILMGHLDYVISVEKQQGLDTAESYGELTKCFTYFTELLHDLNVIINNDGKGQTYGLTHQLDGSKVDELEKLLYSEAGKE